MENATELLVYRELENRLETINDVRLYLSHNYDPSFWEPRFAEQQRKIDNIREWALGLSNEQAKVREYYLSWLKDYYQHGLDSARKELRTQKQRREMDEYHAENARIRDDLASHPAIPTPERGNR